MIHARRTTSVLVACLAAVATWGSGCGSNGDSGGKGDAGDGAGDDGGFQGFGDEGGGGGDGSPACASVSKKAEKVPVDMIIGLDTSFSMDFDDKWTNVKSAL